MIPEPHGRFRDPATWPLGALLANGSGQCLTRVCSRLETDPAPTLALIQHRAMAPFILWRLKEAGIEHPLAQNMLEPFDDIATGWAVRRQLALAELARMAEEKSVRLMVIKGTALALCFYPKSRLRISRDIDVLCRPEEVSAAGIHLPEWDEPGALRPHHAKPFEIQGTPIEFHCRQTYYLHWGYLNEFLPTAQPLPGFSSLYAPSLELAFTSSALHVISHALETPWDLIDIAVMADGFQPDYERMVELWREAGIGSFVWPVLCLCLWTELPVPTSVADRVWEILSRKERKQAEKLLQLLCGIHFQRIRRDQCRCLLRGVSYSRHLAAFLWGDLRTTRSETGLSPANPRFWWQHLVALPKERLGRYFWE